MIGLLVQDDKSALFWACRHGHDEVAKTLIKAGANANSLDKVNNTLVYIFIIN